jgi:hypothetical protein
MADRRVADADRLLAARLMSVAQRHARWRKPTQDETNAVVPDLREIAGDRPDLLAEVAGILLGASEGVLDEPRSNAAASFCIAAGADESLIPGMDRGRPPPSRDQAQAPVHCVPPPCRCGRQLRAAQDLPAPSLPVKIGFFHAGWATTASAG